MAWSTGGLSLEVHLYRACSSGGPSSTVPQGFSDRVTGGSFLNMNEWIVYYQGHILSGYWTCDAKIKYKNEQIYH